MLRTVRSMIACLVLCGLASIVTAQPPDMPKPSPEHTLLKKYVGNWDATMKMQGMEMKCSQTTKAIGEFWTSSTFDGDFGGMKFTGQDTMGWDPKKKKYVNTWVDSMAPHSMQMEGDFDKATNTLTMTGNGVGMDGKPTKNKTTSVWKNDDELDFMLFEEKDGKWVEHFTISYKRKK